MALGHIYLFHLAASHSAWQNVVNVNKPAVDRFSIFHNLKVFVQTAKMFWTLNLTSGNLNTGHSTPCVTCIEYDILTAHWSDKLSLHLLTFYKQNKGHLPLTRIINNSPLTGAPYKLTLTAFGAGSAWENYFRDTCSHLHRRGTTLKTKTVESGDLRVVLSSSYTIHYLTPRLCH